MGVPRAARGSSRVAPCMAAREGLSLEVRSDSVACLTLAMHLRISGQGTGVIARELALVVGCATFRPDFFSHVPGISNVTADILSRKFAPDKEFFLPKMLSNVKETVTQERNRAWWRTLSTTTLSREPLHSATDGALDGRVSKKRRARGASPRPL